jgi:hypothetical protein
LNTRLPGENVQYAAYAAYVTVATAPTLQWDHQVHHAAAGAALATAA